MNNDNTESMNVADNESEILKSEDLPELPEFYDLPLELPIELESIQEDHNLEIPEFVLADELTSEEETIQDDVSNELLWQAKTGLNHDTLCGAIETIIFMNDRPISILKIKALIDPDMPLKVIHESLLRLQNEYEEKHHGIRLLEVAEGYQFRTKATFSKYVQDIFKVNSLVLSPTTLEVLAIIAYKQPVSKTEIDKIRGVDTGHIVRALMDKRLLKVCGRSEELGRPVLYGTTPEFLEVFNLPNIEALPPLHELEAMSIPQIGKIQDIKNLVHSGDKEQFKFDELEELDILSESIKNISADTEFTATLKVEEKRRVSESGVEIKSAFDLLEEFVNKKLAIEQNKMAYESVLLNTVFDAKVVEDLEAGPHNAPTFDDEDDFQMIDLDTGDVITDAKVEDFDFFIDLELDDDNDNDEEHSEESSKNSSENSSEKSSDEDQLSLELDKAFARFDQGNEILSDQFEKDSIDELVQQSDHIEKITNEFILEGEKLNLDLSFLRDTSDS